MRYKRSLISIAMATIMLVSLCAVCASTSVSAVPSSPVGDSSLSSTNADTSAGLVGAPAGVVGAPAVCSRAVNSLDLFVRGTDNAIYYRHRDTSGAWGSWTNLGGRLTSDPSAASYSSGSALFVCARGTDGAFWYRASGPSWTNWNTLGGRLLEGTGPAAFKQGDGVGLAVIGMNHQLYWRAPAWTSLGGYLTSSPGAASEGNTFWVDARGGDGALWSIYTANGGTSWVTWYSLGGRLLEGTGPAVYPSSSLATRMFVIGTNHELFWWHGTYTSLGGYLTSSPAAASVNTVVIDVFARGGDGNIWSRHTLNGGNAWDPWYEVLPV